MKILFNTFCFIVLFGLIFVSCGTIEKNLEEKRIADSITREDSLSMNEANKQYNLDSIKKSTEIINENNIFPIIKISGEFKDSSNYFRVEYLVQNNSKYRFSKIQFEGSLIMKLKDNSKVFSWDGGDGFNDYKEKFNDIKPNDTMEVVNYAYWLQIINTTQLNRTPNSLLLVIKCKAVSVDIEVDDTLKIFDILPLWIDAQKKYGYR